MESQAARSEPAGPVEKKEKSLKLTVAANRLSASIRIMRPDEGQSPVSAEEIRNFLQQNRINHGIDNEAIERLVRESKLDEAVVIARGTAPISGNDSSLIYKFKKIQEFKPREDEDGRIDYRDLNFVQSATIDQVLIEKIAATEGIPGTDVYGQPVSARSGRDIKLPAGVGTKISEDGTRLLAAVDGAIVHAGKLVKINEVHTIGGDVCIETGNIHHNGSLIIRGNVDSNFEVFAKGDIEISKNVADAKIISGGNVMVKGGYLGNNRGLIKAEGDVTVKYINDQVILAGNDVRVGGEVFNASITAKNRIVVSGPRGRIVGGKMMAGDEIKATCLGSDAGTRTELRVAYDAELMRKYQEVLREIRNLEENAERVKEGLYAFYRLQMDNKLTHEKQQALNKLEDFKRNMPKVKQELESMKASLETEIQKNKNARIIGVRKVFPGVILQFGIIYKEITDTMGPTIFQLEGNKIYREAYKPGKDDF